MDSVLKSMKKSKKLQTFKRKVATYKFMNVSNYNELTIYIYNFTQTNNSRIKNKWKTRDPSKT